MSIVRAFGNCYEVFCSVAEEATQGFALEWRLNDEKFAAFKEICDMFDKFTKSDIGTKGFAVEVDKNNTDIVLTMLSNSYESGTVSEEFEKLAKSCKQMEFSVQEDGCAAMAFVFNGVWERTEERDE